MLDQSHGQQPDQHQAGAVRVAAADDCAQLVLGGEVDLSMNSALRAAVDELERLDLPVEVHTRDVTYMDSAVLGMLARLVSRCRHRVTVVDPPELVAFLLHVTEIEDALDIVWRDAPDRVHQGAGGAAARPARWYACRCSGCTAAHHPFRASGTPQADPFR